MFRHHFPLFPTISSSFFKLLPTKNYCSTKKTYEPIDMAYVTFETPSLDQKQAAPVVIVMHSVLGSKSNWFRVCANLHEKTTPQRKIIAVDARNHGESPHVKEHTYHHLAEDVKVLMGKLELRKAAVMGHSMGGRAMMLFALKYVCGL